MRKLFFGGNWKCNNTLAQTQGLVSSLLDKLEFDPEAVDVVVSPVYLHLVTVMFTKKNQHIQVAAQNCSPYGFGAYTGEVTAEQLRDMNFEWVIIGHSERRTHFAEDNKLLANKVESAIKAGLKIIYCFGQTLAQRQKEQTIKVVEQQLEAIRPLVKDWKNVVLAYEPVWAIGTGKNATSDQIQEIHSWIRAYLDKIEETQTTRIIYGGSVNQKNCHDLINIKNVDGFLVGGASLKQGFLDIVKCKKQ